MIVLDVAQHTSASNDSGIQRRLVVCEPAPEGVYERPMQPAMTKVTAKYCKGASSSRRKTRANTMVSAGYAADNVPTMATGPSTIDWKYKIHAAPSKRYASTPKARKLKPLAASKGGCCCVRKRPMLTSEVAST